jgi:hypothetical protein
MRSVVSWKRKTDGDLETIHGSSQGNWKKRETSENEADNSSFSNKDRLNGDKINNIGSGLAVAAEQPY